MSLVEHCRDRPVQITIEKYRYLLQLQAGCSYLNIGAWTELVEATETVGDQVGEDRSQAEDQPGDGPSQSVVHLQISHRPEIGNKPSNAGNNNF